jgi:hypothetical protein
LTINIGLETKYFPGVNALAYCRKWYFFKKGFSALAMISSTILRIGVEKVDENKAPLRIPSKTSAGADVS